MIEPRTCRRQWIRALPLAAVLGLLVPDTAHAAVSCTVSSTSAMSFGVYDPLAATALDTVGTIIYTCPPGQVIKIDLSTGSSGTYTDRTMVNGADRLHYNLYVDAQRQTIWGNGLNGTASGPGQTSKASTDTTAYVFGRIPPVQQVAAGAYSDTVVVTVNF